MKRKKNKQCNQGGLNLAENVTHLCTFCLLHIDKTVHIQFCKTENYLCMQKPERAKCSIL